MFYREARGMTAGVFRELKMKEIEVSREILYSGKLRGGCYVVGGGCWFCGGSLDKGKDILSLMDESYRIVGLREGRLAHMRCFKRSYGEAHRLKMVFRAAAAGRGR